LAAVIKIKRPISMYYLRKLSVTVLLAMLSAGGAQSQNGPGPTQHFEKPEMSFDYPAGWTVTANKWQGVPSLSIAPADGASRIVISTDGRVVLACDNEASKRITSVFNKRVETVIRARGATGSPITTRIGISDREGIQLQGFLGRQPALADVYSFRLNLQLVSLAFIRRVDDSTANSAWQTFRSSLRVESAIVGTLADPADKSYGSVIRGGVLNGKAISLPSPGYPPIARQAHASGTVVVQIIIDESGAVIAAHAVSGHPLLQAVSVAAARQAKFSPTKLCGEPVKVTGVISYNFVAM
jgi:TonB family protein